MGVTTTCQAILWSNRSEHDTSQLTHLRAFFSKWAYQSPWVALSDYAELSVPPHPVYPAARAKRVDCGDEIPMLIARGSEYPLPSIGLDGCRGPVLPRFVQHFAYEPARC